MARPSSPAAWLPGEQSPRGEPQMEQRGEPVVVVGILPLLRSVTGLVWIFWSLLIYQGGFAVPGSYAVSLLYVVAGVAVLGGALLPLNARQTRVLDVVLLAGTLAAFVFWIHAAVYQSPAYGTDEIALGQAGAAGLLHGHDPYGADLGWAFDHFSVPPAFSSFTVTGQEVRTMTYPALSFLFYLPLLKAGIEAQAAVYVDALFWVLGMVVLWLALPPRARPLVPLLASFTFYIEYAVGGVIDSLLLPFLVLALWRWDRFCDPTERSFARWMGPIALGLACATKQTAWFLGVFLIMGIALEAAYTGRSAIRTTARYVGIMAAAFLVPNLPFIVWNPLAWVHGVLTPLALPLVPFGSGFVGLSLYLNIGGGNLMYYKLAATSVALGMVAALVAWYPALRRVIPVVPAIVLLFPTRSLANYFLFVVPGLLVCAATVRTRQNHSANASLALARRVGRVAAIVSVVIGLGCLGRAMASPQPLGVKIVGEHATGQLLTLDTLMLRVTNRTDRVLRPHFMVTLGPYMSTPWIVHRGPKKLAAHRETTYVIWAPNIQSMPAVATGFEVYVFTTAPQAISTSALYQPVAEHTQITPEAVNHTVLAKDHVTFAVRVLDRLNQPVRRVGIPVYLGQVVYAQEGLFPGETSINGKPEGQSPVSARTDANGVAHFTVQALQVQPFEVFYQAWLQRGYSQGYSNLVTLRFVGR